MNTEEIIENMRKLLDYSEQPTFHKLMVTKDQYRLFELAGLGPDDMVVGDFKVQKEDK